MMSVWIIILSCLLLSPAFALILDILKLSGAELDEINKQCYSQAKGRSSEDAPVKVLRKSAAPNNQYPFIAFIGNRGQFACGAVFISQRHLLTVRDCLRSFTKSPSSISLHIGGGCYGKNGDNCDGNVAMKEIPIDIAVFDNQEWSTDSRDLAIVQIKKQLTLKVDFICLSEKNSAFPSTAITVGWGRIDPETPPKYLQHAAIELSSEDSETNFFGIVRYSTSLLPRAQDRNHEFSHLGSNSSAGNVVMTYSTSLKRYVFHGLLLGSSWSGRFGFTAFDGVKIAPFHADLCRTIGLCTTGINRASSIPKLKMISGFAMDTAPEYGFAGGYGENRFTDDGRYCHQEYVGSDSEVKNKPEYKTLVHFNSKEGHVNIDADNDQSFLVQFDLGKLWQLKMDNWYRGYDHPQLSLKVCRKDINLACDKGLLFCWKNGFGKKDPPAPPADNEYIETHCNPEQKPDGYYNGMLVKYEPSSASFSLSFMHSSAKKEIGALTATNGCWTFRFIKWHEKMKEYNYGVYAKDNPSFLPYLRFESFPHDSKVDVDSVAMTVVGSSECNLYAKLESEYATPCYFKWVPSKTGGCGNEGGAQELTCTETSISSFSRLNGNRDINKGEMNEKSMNETETIDNQLSSTVSEIVKNCVEGTVSEITAELHASIKESIGIDFPGLLTAKVEAEVSTSLSNKMTQKMSTSLTQTLTKTATKEINRKLQEIRTLEVIKKTSEEKLEEVKKSVTTVVTSTYTRKPGYYQEQCQMIFVCYGIEDGNSQQTVRPFNSTRYNPPRYDVFT